jgi:queuine tRNA-ribosyltransferase
MSLLDCEVVTTRSGARAMRDRNTGELMHPVVGPLVEAEQLYVEPSRLADRLRDESSTPLVLLDVGLGAGSNAIAAIRVSESLPTSMRPLHVTSFDHSLAALELALHAEHAASFGLEGAVGDAARALVDRGAHESPRTHWRMVLGDLLPMLAREAPETADVVFWDPFSPRANPTLWTMQAFVALRRLCAARATVHTYSAATAVRSALLLAGFAVGVGRTTSSDRDTTIAAVDVRDLEHPLDRRWLERLSRSSSPFPTDAPVDALPRIAAMPQFAG